MKIDRQRHEQDIAGGDLIEAGVLDLHEGRETLAALLVAIRAPRLRQAGITLPDRLPGNPEHRLYQLLAQDRSDSAHSRYISLIRRFAGFERAAELIHRLNEVH